MPYKSEAQRRYFYSQLPELAAKWEADTPKKKLPEKKAAPHKLKTYLDSKNTKY